MPYGVPKNVGGDSPQNVKWMERCVSRVQGQKDKQGRTIDKSRAIAICKATLMKHKSNSAEEANLDNASLEMSFILSTAEYPEVLDKS